VIHTVYLDPRFEKQMRILRRAGKKAALAAVQVDEIIANLQAGKSMASEIGSVTKHGELRIRGCIKYDLGSGYRLLTFKQGGDLFVLYVGSHDECDRWIENNRDLSPEIIQGRCRNMKVEDSCSEKQPGDESNTQLTFEEDLTYPEELDDRHLRIVFRGLIQSVLSNC
jgi:hypothetical protein